MENDLYSTLADLDSLSSDQQGWYDPMAKVDPELGSQEQPFSPEAQDVDDGLVLQDHASFEQFIADHRGKQFESLSSEEVRCVPTDPSEVRAYIKRLFDAFMNTDNVIDKACRNGRAAQSVQRFQGNYYPKEAIEKACWDIFVSSCGVFSTLSSLKFPFPLFCYNAVFADTYRIVECPRVTFRHSTG